MRTTLKRILFPALTFGALALPLATPVAAQGGRHYCPRPHTVNARQNRQERRILQGVGSGELTRRETRGLVTEQNHIERMEQRARATGGEFTARERARIEREQNQASRHIYRQKHDGQDRN